MTFQPCAVHYLFSFFHTIPDSLPCPLCFSFHCKPGGESPSLPTELLLSLCYTWHTGWLTTTWSDLTQVHYRTGEHHNCSSMGHSKYPARAGIKAPCYAVLHKQHSLFLSHWFAFIWFWKWEYVQFVAVSILSIYLLFFRHTYIYKCYIYIMSTHGHMYSRYFKELFIKKSKCYK